MTAPVLPYSGRAAASPMGLFSVGGAQPIVDDEAIVGRASKNEALAKMLRRYGDNSVQSYVMNQALAAGLDPLYVGAIVAQESGWSPTRRPVTKDGRVLSSAYGLFQGLKDERRKFGIGDSSNVEDQTRFGLWKTQQNMGAAKKALGRDPTPGELYVIHYQGIGAGPRILKNPGGDFRGTLNTIRPGWGDTVIRANPWLANIRTNQDFIDWSSRKMDQRIAKLAGGEIPTAFRQPQRPSGGPGTPMVGQAYAAASPETVGARAINRNMGRGTMPQAPAPGGDAAPAMAPTGGRNVDYFMDRSQSAQGEWTPFLTEYAPKNPGMGPPMAQPLDAPKAPAPLARAPSPSPTPGPQTSSYVRPSEGPDMDPGKLVPPPGPDGIGALGVARDFGGVAKGMAGAVGDSALGQALAARLRGPAPVTAAKTPAGMTPFGRLLMMLGGP